MSCRVMNSPVDLSLLAMGTSYVYAWWGPWTAVPGDTTYRVVIDVQNAQNNFVAIPSIQLAAVRPDRPDAASVFTGTATASQAPCSHTPTVTSHMWARTGVAVKVTSGASGSGDVRVTVTRHGCGSMLGRLTAPRQPGPANEVAYLPMAFDVPTVGIGSLKAAILVEGKEGTGNLENRLAARMKATDPENPGTWTLLETGWSVASSTGLTVRNTGGVTVPSGWTDALTADIALAVRGTSADVTALLKAVLAGKE